MKRPSLDTANFLAACTADPSVTDDAGFDDGKVTPKAYCECIAGELAKNNLSQKDVDMLTKMHKEEISDEDVENYPTLEDLLNANEGYEDSCRKSLGLPDRSPAPTRKRSRRVRRRATPEEEEAPAEDDGSPPE